MTAEPDKVELSTPDLAAARLTALQELFPGVVADGVLDAARLGELVDLDVAGLKDGRERYGLMWAGKREAVQSLLKPSRGTLVPDVENSVDFDHAENVFIEGDNLEVLKLLQKAYNDQIKLIYIDPPYNTGKDFVYNDDFKDGLRGYLEFTSQLDEEGNRRSANAETAGRMHGRWLSMMYPRLALARNLLRQDGLLFVSIDDNEVATLRACLDEIFGEENFLATIVWDRGHSQQQGQFKEYHEYVLAYARRKDMLTAFRDPQGGEVVAGAIKKPSRVNPISSFSFPAGVTAEMPDGSSLSGEWGGAETTRLVSGTFHVADGKTTEPMILASAWTQRSQMEGFFHGDGDVFDTRGQRLIDFYFSSTGKLKYRKERGALTPATVQRWGTQGSSSGVLNALLGDGVFDLPKPVGLVRDLVAWATVDGDTVLDFFAGSGTTAHAVLEQNAADGVARRCILVNLPEPTDASSPARNAGYESIADITWARMRAAMEAVDGGQVQGLRTYALSESQFVDPGDAAESDALRLTPQTIRGGKFAQHDVAAEVFIKEGVRLDALWAWSTAGGVDVVTADEVAVVLSTDLSDAVVKEVIESQPRVLVFLEDGFEGDDAVKANAHFSCRQAGITMKSV